MLLSNLHFFRKKLTAAVMALALAGAFLTGCGFLQDNNTTVVLTSGFGEEDVFTVGDRVCTLPEFMVYLVNIRNQYEEVYGEEIWDASLDGVTLEENVREIVLARIAQVKTMALMAQSYEVTLTDKEMKQVREAAQEYYESLSPREVELLGVTEELLENMYAEYALENKVYMEMISDINPEISDDEARFVKLQYIYFTTVFRDAGGNVNSYDDQKKQEIYRQAMQVRSMAMDGNDFGQLASTYSDDDNYSISVGNGSLDPVLDEAAFSMETDEISSVLETENGYYILRCVSTLDREETDANKLAIVEQRRQEAFESEYDTFVEGVIRNLNTPLWESVEAPEDDALTTSDFFRVYDSHFQGVFDP
ncbi:MAG: peptidylprolyl isomerase [Lachnospiraceae bacterium]|nr:peptidylprolyl isomerase [Lachnospiraceae bacterium]